ncbi:MAG: hypothetical protein HRU15_12525, partial [Planctomycetes bacterium]|nr:hypothetical protein [Planctomycetota bacterium]
MIFQSAQPVWIDDQESLAQFIGFYASVEIDREVTAVLSIAAVNAFRIWHNGRFVAHGPARCAHGFARVDQLAIALVPGRNHIAIEVVAYHMNSFDHLDQDGMLCAELAIGEKILLRSDQDFTASLLSYRMREVPRYSFQRTSVEVYNLNEETEAWISNGFEHGLSLHPVQTYQFLERNAPYPRYEIIAGTAQSQWTCAFEHVEEYPQDRSMTDIGEDLKGFTIDELKVNPQQIIQGCRSTREKNIRKKLQSSQAQIFDLQRNRSGFIQCAIECAEDAQVLISFDERLNEDDDVYSFRMGCVNVLTYNLAAGRYDLESFAPYTARFIKVHIIYDDPAKTADSFIHSCAMRSYENPRMFDATLHTDNQELQDIFIAGQHTI